MARQTTIRAALVSAGILGGSVLLPARAPAVGSLRPQIEETPVYQGVVEPREAVVWAAGDLSGDRRREVIVGFKDQGERPGTRGGILIFASRLGRYQKVYGALWERAFPRELRVAGRRLEVLVVEITEVGELPLEQTLMYENDIVFDDEPGGLMRAVSVEASSTLAHFRAQTDPLSILDGDLKTGWAEDGRGTGVGEWIRLEFEEPVSISLLGMASGDHRSDAHRKRSNRVHRSEVTVRTTAEEGDPVAGLSYQELGLDFPGERVPMRLSDRMGLQYFEVDRAEVRALEIRISSVYVGDRFDDTWITAVDVLGRLPPPPFPFFVVAPLDEGESRNR